MGALIGVHYSIALSAAILLCLIIILFFAQARNAVPAQ
jgi:hypothetical protein